MRLRAAVLADVPALVALEETLFGAEAWSRATVTSDLDAPGRLVVVAVEDEAVVGYAVTMHAGDVTDLQRIAVAPDHQRRGLAAALLADVVAAARADGAARMLLEVSTANVAAVAFYVAAGFVEVDRRRRYYRDGTDAVVMARSLEAVSPGGRG